MPAYLDTPRSPRPFAADDRRAHARSNGRRAVRAVRLYVRENALAYLWTLTYKEAARDRGEVVADLRRFFIALQARYGRMPIVAVIERGTKNTRRLHVHFAAPKWLPVQHMRTCWRRGNVWVGDPGKLSGHTSARRLSAYLSKYVSKQIAVDELDAEQPDLVAAGSEPATEPDRASGAHRYYCTQGWSPVCYARRVRSFEAAGDFLAAHYGRPSRVWDWRSDDLPDLFGVVLIYDDKVIARWRRSHRTGRRPEWLAFRAELCHN